MRKTMFEMAAEIISSLHKTYRTLQSLQSAENQGVQITDQTGEVDITPE